MLSGAITHLLILKQLTFLGKSHIMSMQWKHCTGSGQICWRGAIRGLASLFFAFFRKHLTFSRTSHRIVVPIRQVRFRDAPTRSLLNRRSGFFYKPFDFSAHFIYNDFANKAGAFRNHQPASTVRGRGLFLFLEMLFPLLDGPLIAQPFFDRLMLRFRKPVVCFRKITLIKRFIFFPALCLDLDPDQQL